MKKYVYHDNKKNFENKEDIEVALEAQLKNNLVKDTTLTHIPSGFKSILLASIDPTYYYVDFINNEYRKISIFGSGKTRIKLTKDCLVEQTNVITEFDGSSTVSYSYDYVQDHFSEIESPVEQYKDKIVYDE